MPKLDLHIISFDVPYPANYGGVIDVYYKLKALKEEGLNIALHCFYYGREEQIKLNELCAEVYYYPRKTGVMTQLSVTPYIVAGRKDAELLDNLSKDEAPILFEGLHTTCYLGHPKLKSRRTAVRVHNREDEYYAALFEQSKSFYKKMFYGLESNRLKYFEKRLARAETLFCLNKEEQEYYSNRHKDSRYLPAFHPYQVRNESLIKHQLEQAVYFGNLAVEENSKAVEFLLDVFTELELPLKIAGRGADSDLIKKMGQLKNVEYLGELSDTDLNRLIQESKVCCLPTLQSTGVKLKFIQALFSANTILLNKKMLAEKDFESFCSIAETKEEWREQLMRSFETELDNKAVKERMILAKEKFNNQDSAKLLVEWCAQVQ